MNMKNLFLRVRVDRVPGLAITGARGLGPVIVDAPEAYFNPAELVEALAPAILQAKDQGRQFIVAVSDPAFPFAADAELVIPCERDRSGAGVGTLSPAQGGLDNPRTAAWLLKNWEGSAKVFDRRKQLYEGVLGEMGAAERRGEMVRE